MLTFFGYTAKVKPCCCLVAELLRSSFVAVFLLLLLLLLQATYLRAAKVNHIGESEARLVVANKRQAGNSES